MFKKIIILLIWTQEYFSDLVEFNTCHDDFSLQPNDGVLPVNSFPWLGFIQYLHITTGMDHHSKAPRVVLIHQHFVLATARDMLRLPKNYKLGNVVFGEYFRDESECGIDKENIKFDKECPKAYIEIPIQGINPHPEFSRFGVSNSLALVKLMRPLKSKYMVPACLPTFTSRQVLRASRVVFMVDYISLVPHDFEYERMGKKTLKLYTHKDCKRHRRRMKVSRISITHALCSTGCGVRPGAPILSHSEHGTFELIGMTVGGAPCSNRTMRRHLNDDPPLYTDVYPYRTWIVNVVTANVIPNAYPQTYRRMDDGMTMGIRKGYFRQIFYEQKSGWRARTFVSGDACYDPHQTFSRENTFFYSEKFNVNADPPGKLNVYIMFSGGVQCTITCARLILPNRYFTPVIHGVGGFNITVEFTTVWFPYAFYFSLGLWGRNSSREDEDVWKMNRRPGFY